jgi:tellurite resistance protein
MELTIPTPDIALAGLRGMKMIALADGELHALERRLMDSAQKHILSTDFDLDALPAITPAELASAIREPELRERVLSACILVALIDGEASPNEGVLLQAFARAFELKSAALDDVQRLIDDQLLVMRLDIARRSFLGQRGRAYMAEQGVRGFGRTLRSLFGIENPKLAARYQALEQLPRGILGREYVEFVRANDFALPGEPNAAPELVLFHDCLHVLGGYSTTSIEETQIASFQAGMLRKDPLFGLLFMLAQFHLGVQITPITAAEKLVADPDLMLQAFVRGTRVNRDLCTDWDPTQDLERPVEELRHKYNILLRALAPTAA